MHLKKKKRIKSQKLINNFIEKKKKKVKTLVPQIKFSSILRIIVMNEYIVSALYTNTNVN